jgi:glycosyltransferase involved in cell wall biosynthesis
VVSFDLVRTLQRDYDVTVLARILESGESARARELERFCSRVATVLPANRASMWRRVAYKLAYLARSTIGRRSLKSLYDCPGALVRAARELANEDFDLIVMEYWQLYPLFLLFPADRVVLLTHDIDLLVNRQSALLERNLFRKVAKVRRWLIEQREEIAAYRGVRRVLALTERDARAVEIIRKRDDGVDVLPFGIDPDAYPEASARDRREVLFMGALRAVFNADALRFFAREVYPHLTDEPDVRYTVVGGALPRGAENLARDPRVEVVGRVADVRPYLARARCLVVPLRFGGGLRIRILEAMMAGLPVVCSSVAIAGMDFRPGTEFLLADTGVETAREIRRLLGDQKLAASISANARRAVVERYGAGKQAERTRTLFRDILQIF